MFTGIITALGAISAIKPLGKSAESGLRLTLKTPRGWLSDVDLGDSIAINGACMTVVAKTAGGFDIDVSRESLSKTTGLESIGNEVNLEKALRLSDRLGGHLVSGHVDGTGTVKKFAQVGESWQLVIRAPKTLAKYLAYKGSITVNGVSLTVNQVTDLRAQGEFSINLIPHTVQVTALKHLREGAPVNLEIDTVARYVERMLSSSLAK